MRQIDQPEPIDQLGEVVRNPAPEPADQKVSDVIMRRPDGTLYTVDQNRVLPD